MNTNDWEKKFEKQATALLLDFDFKVKPSYQIIGEFKALIKDLLHSHNQELVKRIEGMKVRKWEIDPPSGISYNQALTDIINLLKNG